MNDDREAILAAVRAALRPLPHRAAPPEWDESLVRMKSDATPADLSARFTARMTAAHGRVFSAVAELGRFLVEQGFLRGYIDPALADEIGPALPPEIGLSPVFARNRIDDCQFGITRAAGAIADTGTVILSDRSTVSRLAALAPWVHVAVVRADELFPDLTAALAAMGDDPNVIWCTGPSKTADVEGILIEGVHGPGIQIALLLPPAKKAGPDAAGGRKD